jgi:hypothetical protein
MSQLSQFSDAGPLSLYENDIDTFSYFPTDELPISALDPPSSIADTDFLRPLSVLSTLKQIGPDYKKLWVVFSDIDKDEFINWWL